MALNHETFWFPLNAGDFLAEAAQLRLPSIACLVLLRCHIVRFGAVPNNRAVARLICRGAPWRDIAPALALLVRGDDGFYCPKIRATQESLKASASRRSAAGRAAAAARWAEDKQTNLSI